MTDNPNDPNYQNPDLKLVTVEALKYHTHDGKAYNVGDTYDIEARYVESVAAQGMAVRVDRAAHAQRQRAEAPKPIPER